MKNTNCQTQKYNHVLNFFTFMGTRILAIVLFAVSVPVFISNTSESSYGVVAIGFSLLNIVFLMDTGFGYLITQSVGRRLARSGRTDNVLFSQLFWVYFVIASVLALILFTVLQLLWRLGTVNTSFFSWIVLLLPLLAVNGVTAAILRAHNELAYLSLSRFIFELAKAGSLLGAALIFESEAAIVPSLMFMAIVRVVFDYTILRKKLRYKLLVVRPDKLRKLPRLLLIGAPAIGTVAVTLLLNIGDKVFLAAQFSTQMTAYFSISWDLTTKAYLLIYAMNATLFAAILHQAAKGNATGKTVNIGLWGVLMMILFYYLPLALFSETIVTLWINKETAIATKTIIPVLCLSSIFYLFGSVYENALMASGHPKTVFITYCISLISFLVVLLGAFDVLKDMSLPWAYVAFFASFAARNMTDYKRLQKN